MNAVPGPQAPSTDDTGNLARVVDAIADKGYIVIDGLLPAEVLDSLYRHYQELDLAQFKPAGVGREQAFQLNQKVRRDEIYWLDGHEPQASGYFELMEQLRLWMNRELFLGLFDYECHYAYYPEGAFYKRHVDAFVGRSNRRLTTVLYLNPQWTEVDGGELLMYQGEEQGPFEVIQPLYGRMVIFLSERFPHEVAPARRERFSLAGWFRINASTTDNLDPPK